MMMVFIIIFLVTIMMAAVDAAKQRRHHLTTTTSNDQNNDDTDDDKSYPLQLIPVVASSTTDSEIIQYTMWTPMNWTYTTTTTKSDQQPLPPPLLQYNAYLVSTTNSQAFRVIIPPPPPPKKPSNRGTKFRNNNAIRIEEEVIRNHHYKTTRTRMSTIPFLPTSDHHQYHYSLQRTSIQSQNHYCHYAMNGGPFHADGSMIGYTVVEQHNGTTPRVVVSSNDDDDDDDFDGGGDTHNNNNNNIGFGLAQRKNTHMDTTNSKNNNSGSSVSSSTSYWVIGRIQNRTHIHSLGITQFMTGFDWLVFNGTNIAAGRNNTTGANRASRSTMGVTANGTLLLLVTDGCEHCVRHQGMTLSEVADILVYLGAQYAINMDGGSSSVLVAATAAKNTNSSSSSSSSNGSRILNQPSCYYNAIIPRKWIPCERSVASVVCLSNKKG